MSGQLMTRSRFPESMKREIRATWGTLIKNQVMVRDKIYMMMNSEDNDEEFVKIPGLGLPEVREEGAGTASDDIGEFYKVTARHFFQAKMISFTREFIGDNKQRLRMKSVQSLAQVMNQGVEAASAAPFNMAKATTIPSRFGGDEKSLLATDHPNAVGGTFANTTSAYMAPSNNAIQVMLNMMRANRNDKNIPEPLMPKKLICATNTCLRFKEILQPGGKDDTTDNVYNVIPGEGLTQANIVEHFYIENQQFWAIQTSIPEEEGGVYFERMPVEMNEDEDPQKWVLHIIAGRRFSIVYLDPRWIFGQA